MLGWLLDRWYTTLPESPAVGRIERLVRRTADGDEVCAEAEVDGTEGVHGDLRSPLITLANSRVLLALAEGDQDRAARSGDQVQIDLCLDNVNLPTDGLVTIGSVILVALEERNAPDAEFTRALGSSAAARVRRHNRKGLGGSRRLCRVLQGGTLHLGDKAFIKNTGVRIQP